MRGVSIYRPNNDISKGCAFQFNPGLDKHGDWGIFVEAAKQVSPKPAPGSTTSPFDWKQKLLMMLSIEEAADLAASIRGISRKTVKFIHKFGEGENEKTSFLTIGPPENKEYDNWSISFTVKKNGLENRVNGFISPGQIYQILTLIDSCIHRSFNFAKLQKKQVATEATST